MSKPVFSRPQRAIFPANDNYLIISDAHLPMENERALEFCVNLVKLFKINHVYCVGDFLDLYHFSRYEKSPDVPMTLTQEIEFARKKIKLWHKELPNVHFSIGNHEARYWKKSVEAQLPSQVLRSIEEVFEIPDTWKIKDHWHVKGSRKEFLVIHGDGYSGPMAHRTAVQTMGISVAMGHTHSGAGVSWLDSQHSSLWALNVGCLVDRESFAFEYGKSSKWKPSIGCGVVLSGGEVPLFVPLI